jgi:cell division protein YceG involved in septum cleavage
MRYNKDRSFLNKIRMFIIGGLFLLLLILLSMFFFTRTVTAKGSHDRVKLVTSVEVKKGDTLWSIAANYLTDEYDDIADYIEELKKSNGLTNDTIHAGNYIIVPYYADASN